jgi:hypothetical protein
MVWPLKISFQGHLTTQLLKQRCTLYFNEIRLGRRIDKELQYEKVCSRIMCIPPLYFRNCIWRDTFFCLVWELCGVIDMKYDHASMETLQLVWSKKLLFFDGFWAARQAGFSDSPKCANSCKVAAQGSNVQEDNLSSFHARPKNDSYRSVQSYFGIHSCKTCISTISIAKGPSKNRQAMGRLRRVEGEPFGEECVRSV